MRGKRGPAGERAHALPMQEPARRGLAARMLLFLSGNEFSEHAGCPRG